MMKIPINKIELINHEQNILETQESKYDTKTITDKRTTGKLVLTFNEPVRYMNQS